VHRVPKKFVNIFEGFDNSQPLSFENLKRQTFKDIFHKSGVRAHSLKKTLNYANYSNEERNIITKEEILPIYRDFKDQMA
jgi:hypothetical protein